MGCFIRAFNFIQCIILIVSHFELAIGQQEKYLNGFIDFLNNLPNQPYVYEEGILINTYNTGDNVYKIEVSLKVSKSQDPKSFKLLKCTATVQDQGESGITVQENGYQCNEDIVQPNPAENNSEVGNADFDAVDEANSTGTPIQEEPVRLDNEVQSDTAVTSGEQFVAIPRNSPIAPCIGCSSYVNPSAPGVYELALLGVRHLDRHETNVKHSLQSVIEVERQVQVVNGVRYILLLVVDYNNCTSVENTDCSGNRTCKISILEKPWVKFPDGSKFRAVLANNCTEEWQYGDNGEVVPQLNKEENDLNPLNNGDHNAGGAEKSINEEFVNQIHIVDSQAQPQTEKTLTDAEIKQIEEQIIPHVEILRQHTVDETTTTDGGINIINEVVAPENRQVISDNFIQQSETKVSADNKAIFTDEKKKAIDDLLNFFNYAGFNTYPFAKETNARIKRSYDDDLEVLSIADKLKNLKRKVDDAKYVYKLAEILVNYLNEMDMEVKSRVLKDVITAEEEFENHQHFVYLQARVQILCDHMECKGNENITKICNAVIDNSDVLSPQVLNHFCYHEKVEPHNRKLKSVPLDDPVLLKLSEDAVKKIESESSQPNAIIISRLGDANTQRASGIITKITMEIVYTNCSKSVPLKKRDSCTVLDKLGSKLCEVIVHERSWLNDIKISYTCTERNFDENISTKFNTKLFGNVNDPKITEMVQEALQYLEIQSNRNNKQKVVDVTSVSTQLVAGLLTNIDFVVGYTTCTNDFEVNINKCDLLKHENLRKCHAQIWDRSWLEDGKQVNVTCDDAISGEIDVVNNIIRRKKRSLNKSHKNLGGSQEEDPNDPKFTALAEESLQKYLASTGNKKSHRVLRVTHVTVQVVAGTLTQMNFSITPTDGDSGDYVNCYSKVWDQPWLNKKEIKVDCNLNNRQKRNIPIAGGPEEKDPNDPEFTALAEESLQKYLASTGNKNSHRVLKVTHVTVQTVAGTLTQMNFSITPTDGDSGDYVNCYSKVWDQPWLNKKEIEVDCNLNNRQKRNIRIAGGPEEKDPNDPEFTALAEESLQKYLASTGNKNSHRVLKVTHVTVQTVAGTLTQMNFSITPTDGDSGDYVNCYSKVWDQPWLNKKEIEVDCNLNNRQKRNIRIAGGPEEKDPNDPEFTALAEESLQKYLASTGNKNSHRVLKVTHVTVQVVAGTLTQMNFSITPTEGDSGDYVNCYSKVWDRPWLNKKEINVDCNLNNRQKRKIFLNKKNSRYTNVALEEEQDSSDPYYKVLAEDSLKKYQISHNVKYAHKIVRVERVTRQIISGVLYSIDYVASPTVCLLDDVSTTIASKCELQDPDISLNCQSVIWDRPWLKDRNEVNVSCNIVHSVLPNHIAERFKRQIRPDDYELDEDTKFYYAERAIQHLNDHMDSRNMQKLISIHATQTSMHMGMLMVRMYIEAAHTYCLSQEDGYELNNCEEIDGLNHRLCLARLWPAPDDDLIINQVHVVCDDDKDFEKITGLSIVHLIKASIKELEQNSNIRSKLLQRGEPSLIPSLDHSEPIKLSFIVSPTNCSKDVNLDLVENMINCFVDESLPPRACHSFIWMAPNGKTINQIRATCSHLKSRQKRSVGSKIGAENQTSDDQIIHQLVLESIEQLEMTAVHRYKQRLLQINSYTTKITTGKLTTIDFDVGYTSCLKYEWVDNITKCEFLEHLPRRHCVSNIYERLWIENGKQIEVNCEDDETPLEAHIEFESAETATMLANEALKHIEAKYPHPRKQKLVRIFSLERQNIAGVHYRMKIEVGFTNCLALTIRQDCHLVNDAGLNKFCRVNIWIRPWSDNPPNFRVACDYQESATADMYHQIQAEHLFYDFITTYKPTYSDDFKEMGRRFKIFKENIKKIHELNTHERGTATYAITRFADLSYEEFSSRHLGLKLSLQDPNQIPLTRAAIPKIDIPDSFDWREHDAVTEVKNQGSCGSCWAFSVTGNVEGQYKMQTGKLVSLSEQELVDCDKLDEGCNGGLPDNAYRAIEQLGGLELEKDYPYEGEDDKCSFNKTMARVQISGAVNISSNETNMAKWLVKNGPISIGINANAMQFYVGGISHPWKILCNPGNLDHGVLIVGYGVKDYPLFHKHLPYWVIKNSWGPQWGEQGYYRVYRGDGTCGVNMMASSAII